MTGVSFTGRWVENVRQVFSIGCRTQVNVSSRGDPRSTEGESRLSTRGPRREVGLRPGSISLLLVRPLTQRGQQVHGTGRLGRRRAGVMVTSWSHPVACIASDRFCQRVQECFFYCHLGTVYLALCLGTGTCAE